MIGCGIGNNLPPTEHSAIRLQLYRLLEPRTYQSPALTGRRKIHRYVSVQDAVPQDKCILKGVVLGAEKCSRSCLDLVHELQQADH